jgi:tRNA (guanosine-2'-O-)-methyltransferase
MTPQRFARLNAVLNARQPDLTVLMDNVHKTHNFSAILRSCDAVGVAHAHAGWPDPRFRPDPQASGGAGKWVEVVTHDDVQQAITTLLEQDFQIVAAHPVAEAVDFREVDYTRPTALLVGAELLGVSAPALALATQQVLIPMHGMVASLNVSVATATLLFEAQRQRQRAGMYEHARLDPRVRARMLFHWAHPVLARYCDRHGLHYPRLDEHGELAEPLPRPAARC